MAIKLPSFVHAPKDVAPVVQPVESTPDVRPNPLLALIRSQQGQTAATVPADEATPKATEKSPAESESLEPPFEDGLAGDDSIDGPPHVDFDKAYAEYAESLQGEIIEPEAPLPEGAFESDPSESTEIAEVVGFNTNVNQDHLRRAAMQAMRMFNIMEGVQIIPDPSQVNAVHTLVHEQYGCLIGAAGTGKTTTTRLLLHTLMNGDPEAGIEPIRISSVSMKEYRKATATLDEHDAEYDPEEEMERAAETRIPGVALCAFTGQATQVLRKNLPPQWRANAMTIHSLLAFAPEEFIREDGKKSMRFVPTYTAEFKMPWDIIVVDEASMVNLDLWHMLLAAAKPGCRFYFIGDLNQLPPPVGMGILGFALAKWVVCELTVVHRQTDEAANRIIDTAHAILNGKQDQLTFDDPKTNPNWRVIGFELDNQVVNAQVQVVNIAASLSKKRVAKEVHADEPAVYDPWRDRIMTPGNGYNPEEVGHQLGQYPLNEVLSQIFVNKDVPRIIIDCQRATKKFAVDYRVMATKNEPPDAINRVTNGLTGRITDIFSNPQWVGDRRLVGEETQVRINREIMVAQASMSRGAVIEEKVENLEHADEMMQDFEFTADAGTERVSGPASHIVCVKFDNGAYREYNLNAEIEQLQIAYASTVHKAQGAEMPTAIIVIHHANKFHLNREGLYTGVTRAKERVILLYTQFGLRLALSKQKVSGRNLKEKIANYLNLMGGEDGNKFKTVKVRLTEND